MSEEKKCPVTGETAKPVVGSGTSNRDWWPNQLNLNILHQHSAKSNPMGEEFNYAYWARMKRSTFRSCLIVAGIKPKLTIWPISWMNWPGGFCRGLPGYQGG